MVVGFSGNVVSGTHMVVGSKVVHVFFVTGFSVCMKEVTGP